MTDSRLQFAVPNVPLPKASLEQIVVRLQELFLADRNISIAQMEDDGYDFDEEAWQDYWQCTLANKALYTLPQIDES